MSLKARIPITSVSRPTIGWREWVSLPEIGVKRIKAKVDTGARTSSLHAFDLEEMTRDGQRYVRFTIHPEQRRQFPSIHVELPLIAHRTVRDSGGKAELRPVVRTVISLFGRRWPIELTLARRDAMGFRMLLGRRAIRRKFIVDPGSSFLAEKRPRSGKKRLSNTEGV